MKLKHEGECFSFESRAICLDCHNAAIESWKKEELLWIEERAAQGEVFKKALTLIWDSEDGCPLCPSRYMRTNHDPACPLVILFNETYS